MQHELKMQAVSVGGLPPITHDFKQQLAWSEAGGDESFWVAAYRSAFPNFVNCMQTTGDTAAQRMGIDRVIALSNGVNLRIDEKKRRKDYGDILLEYISVDTTGALGWIEKDLQIDYLAYAFMESHRVYLLPWLLLRKAWIKNGTAWIEAGRQHKAGFRLVEADNRRYKTLSVAVPTNVLFNAISKAALIRF